MIDSERLKLRAIVGEKYRLSRCLAGSRSIVAMLATEGIQIGRFKVRRLMKEALRLTPLMRFGVVTSRISGQVVVGFI